MIAPNAVRGAEIASNAVGGSEADELSIPIPTAWAEVLDPDGSAQPDGDPRALASEGVLNINDGDDGSIGGASGFHCYDLGFRPDLILATLRPVPGTNPTTIFRVQNSSGSCGSGYEAQLSAYDPSGSPFDDASLFIAFFDLE